MPDTKSSTARLHSNNQMPWDSILSHKLWINCIFTIFVFMLLSCQGSSHENPQPKPPGDFSYSSGQIVLTLGKTITPLFPIGGESGVYYTSIGLPWGLNLDANSGAITGTPTAANPVTRYTIIANKQVWQGSILVNLQTPTDVFIVVNRSGFTLTGSMITARHAHTATVIQGSGKVLIAGGSCNGQVLASAEIYDPATGVFTFAGSMHTPRINHTAVALSNGTVLFFGGDDGTNILSSVEEYNVVTGVFKEVGPLKVARHLHSSTLFYPSSPNSSPTILVAGGEGINGWLASTELFDTTTGLSVLGPSMLTARGRHGACGAGIFGNPDIIIAGGFNGNYLSNVEYYNSFDGAFYTAGSLNVPLADFSMTDQAKPSGNAYILISGGIGAGGITANLGLYKYESNSNALPPYFEVGPMMMSPRQGHASVYLWYEMRTFIAGGIDNAGHVLSSTEIYDIKNKTISSAGLMNFARAINTVTYLDNGLVLITGGIDSLGSSLSSAELY